MRTLIWRTSKLYLSDRYQHCLLLWINPVWNVSLFLLVSNYISFYSFVTLNAYFVHWNTLFVVTIITKKSIRYLFKLGKHIRFSFIWQFSVLVNSIAVFGVDRNNKVDLKLKQFYNWKGHYSEMLFIVWLTESCNCILL